MTKICLIGGIFLIGEYKKTHDCDILIKPLIISGDKIPFAVLPDNQQELDVSRCDFSYPTTSKIEEVYKKAISQVVTPESKIISVN